MNKFLKEMACNSLSALPRSCGNTAVAGLEKVYMIAFKDLKAISTATTEVYSANTSTGVVNTVGLQSGKTFVEIGLLKSTAGLNAKLTKDPTKGYSFYNQTFNLVLGGLSVDNLNFIEAVNNQPVAVIARSRTGQYFVAGLNGQLELKDSEVNTGVSETDSIGGTLTFEGISPSLKGTQLIDDTLVPSLIS